VVTLHDDAALDALDLSAQPVVDHPLPEGQNVEYIVRREDRLLGMRVHERGVGETKSCGTGICAAVVATANAESVQRDGLPWRVQVPGGECTVTWRPDDHVLLTGPAVIVADIELRPEWVRQLDSIESLSAVSALVGVSP
jgi:diaminopimelate epimerase